MIDPYYHPKIIYPCQSYFPSRAFSSSINPTCLRASRPVIGLGLTRLLAYRLPRGCRVVTTWLGSREHVDWMRLSQRLCHRTIFDSYWTRGVTVKNAQPRQLD